MLAYLRSKLAAMLRKLADYVGGGGGPPPTR
jgi:hypothetical protein